MSSKEIRKRPHRYTVYLSDEELQSFQQHAESACMKQSDYARLLFVGLVAQQDKALIKELTIQMQRIGNNINQIRARANALGFVDAPELDKALKELMNCQADVEKKLLRPTKMEELWQ